METSVTISMNFRQKPKLYVLTCSSLSHSVLLQCQHFVAEGQDRNISEQKTSPSPISIKYSIALKLAFPVDLVCFKNNFYLKL